MSHRGRLNVMVHIVGRPAAEVFAKFEDVDPRSVLGGGDVKYHIGATGDFPAAKGGKVEIHLVSNPSHLEAVDPVAIGRARAKQTRIGESGAQAIVPVVMHGDAAFAGQGICAETLNMAGVEGFNVGGSVHIIVNNLIGFTTVPRESHSSRFSSDLSKRLPIPIFHVNAEDPEAVRASVASRSTIAMHLARRSLWTSSAIASTVTAKWTIPPSPSRFATRKFRRTSRSGKFTRKKSVSMPSRLSKKCARNSTPRKKRPKSSRKIRRCANYPPTGMPIVADDTSHRSKWTQECPWRN